MQKMGAKKRQRELVRQERQRQKEADRQDRRSKSDAGAPRSGDPDEDPDLAGMVAGPQPPVVD
jgi:hypothetical protein